ncbi:iron (metal) dependent repressor, DtxR family [Streptococcus equinus]|uniref:Manganese transport regulator n=1 Tax=Streptococcus equinus TaxID=1335 RepID=A0A1H0JLN6_STREI|nr:metal-dependent transcriptional regulator [Streptococcus equinus]SDO44440.1 iron (metal) dependent repressor, DtxR family [Streptococcus equinus]
MTPNKEDYLKCIHELGETQTKISNKRIAALMQVSAPAVTEMVKKLIAEGLIVKDKEAGYYLTRKGLLLVSQLYRKHRLIEVFLTNHLHYNPDEVHQEAEVLEHTVSTLFIDRLEEKLNYPDFCPHGSTIPKKGNLLIEIHNQALSQVEELGKYQICRTHDEARLLNYLEEHQLTINDVVELVKIDDFAKTHTLTYRSQEIVIPERIAEQIYVEKVD